MIKKEQIDKYFIENQKGLLLAIKKTKSKYNPNGDFEPEELIGIIYEYLLDNIDKMTKETDIEAFTMKFMSNQIRWSQSNLNRKNGLLKNTDYVETFNTYLLVDDDEDLNDKLRLEDDFNHKKAILFEFYKQLPTKEEKILFQVIFEKNITTIANLSKHFGINQYYIQKMKKKLFDDLNEYINNNKETIKQ